MLSVSLSAWLSSVSSRIPGTLKNLRHVSCCRRSRLNQTPKLVPRVHSFWVNYDLQMVSQVDVGRSRRPQNRSVAPIHRSGYWGSKNCFPSQVRWAGVPSCANHIVCPVANGTSPSSWGNSSVKTCKQDAPESRGGSSQAPMKRLQIIPAETLIVNLCLIAAQCCHISSTKWLKLYV
jgi:hypothetical protein